jgi:serine/threonine protein phosphatase PrpC
VELGAEIDLEARPRTTCTVCLVTANRARWAHVGDSRIYLLREAGVQVRTRDHSTVEMLYREGMIERAEIATHPLRNYVEECLGGEPERPLIEVGEETVLEPGDIVLLCSDGFWAPLEASAWSAALWKTEDLQCELEALAAKAERESRPASDNVTAVAARWRTGAHDVSSNRP